MKSIELFKKIIRLMVETDAATEDWVEQPSLMNPVYLITGLSVFLFLLGSVFIKSTPLEFFLTNSELGTLLVRGAVLVCMIIMNLAVFVLAYNYLLFVLDKKGNIFLNNVFFLLFLNILCFGLLYNALYILDSGLFNCQTSLEFGNTWATINHWELIKLRLDFFLFSSMESVNSNFFKISSNSLLTSLLTLIQKLYTLCLVTIFMSSYVSRKLSDKNN